MKEINLVPLSFAVRPEETNFFGISLMRFLQTVKIFRTATLHATAAIHVLLGRNWITISAGHLSARPDFLTSGQAEGEKGWLETIMIVSTIRSASG